MGARVPGTVARPRFMGAGEDGSRGVYGVLCV